MEYLRLGTISGSFGLDGTLKVISSTDFPSYRYEEGNVIYLYNPQSKERSELTVESFRCSGKIDFVKVKEITVKEDADKLKSFELQCIKDELEDGFYYFSDLEKMEVIDEEGNILGKVKKVEEYPAQITLRISRKKGPDFFVPFIDAFIVKVNTEEKQITIKVIGGML